MKYSSFGRTGLKVSELALGGMTIGNAWGWGTEKEEATRIFKKFTEEGGNFIDTSCNYQNGHSESILGELIKENRDDYVIATKYTLHDFAKKNDPNAGGNNRKNLLQSIKGSLKRLQTDYLDILYLHVWDYSTNIEEIIHGLNLLIENLQVTYIAISDTPAWVAATANAIANVRGWEPFTGYQFPYNLARRDAEREIIPFATAQDMSMLVWNVIGSGLFTGKYTRNKETKGRIAKGILENEERLNLARKVDTIADQIGCTSSQLAHAWVMSKGKKIIPLIGVTSATQLEDTIGSLQVNLTQEQIKEVENISFFEPGFPADFTLSSGVHDLIYGNTFDKIKF